MFKLYILYVYMYVLNNNNNLNIKKKKKKKKKKKIIIIIIIIIIPMAVETFGGWGLESRPVFATLVDRISGRTGQAKSCVINQLYQRLAITLQRQMPSAMIVRQPL